MSASAAAEAVISQLCLIFSQSILEVTLAGLTEEERRRNVVFYDEVVPAAVRLRIPASGRTVPAPSSTARVTSFSLPLDGSASSSNGAYSNGTASGYHIEGDEDGAQSSETEDEHGSASSKRPRPPQLLRLLIQSLRTSLEAAYVPPRLSRGPPQATSPAASRGGSHPVIASVDDEDAAYQSVSLSNVESNGEAVCMFKEEWAGNAVPPTPSSSQSDTSKDLKASRREKEFGAAETWFAKGEWIVEWRCPVPIVFLRSRHPAPALVIGASLTLSLQPSQLSVLAPGLVPPAKTSASEAVFLHDLLNPLSEGPSYPDESPAERAARADASLAKLPLGKLPSSILGSKLVTPSRAAKAIGKMVEERAGNGKDVDEIGEGADLASGKSVKSLQLTTDAEDAQGLGEEMVMVRRSARRALDVRSAILVRMRTTNIACVGEAFGQAPDPDAVEDNLVPTLVLCVEIENPTNSGIKFAFDEIKVDVSMPTDSMGVLSPFAEVQADAVCIGDEPTSTVLEQGTQQNLLYHVRFQLPYTGTTADGIEFDPIGLMRETQRSISIRLAGRPILLRKDEEQDGVLEYTPTNVFTSTWSCTLDFATQVHALVLQRVIADGAGGAALGRLRAEDRPTDTALGPTQAYPGPLASTFVAPRVDPTGSGGTANTTGRTPQIRPSLAQRNISQGPGLRNPSSGNGSRPALRSAVGAHSETFVSLQRTSDSPRIGAQEPSGTSMAMPSSMVGPSILARARRNRIASGIGGKLGGDLSSDGHPLARRSTLVKSPRVPQDEGGRFSSRLSGMFNHRHKSSGVWSTMEGGSQVLALGTKGSWLQIPNLIRSAGVEQGLLIDITAIKEVPDLIDISSAQTFASGNGIAADGVLESRCKLDVQLQVDNRSDVTRTLIARWKTSASGVNALRRQLGSKLSVSSASSAAAREVLLLPCEDAVQVGPIGAGQSELAMLRLVACLPQGPDQTSAKERTEAAARDASQFALTTLPPLVILDVESGTEHTLASVQPIEV